MKFPKDVRTYCPKCKSHTDHKTKPVKNRGRGKAKPNAVGNRQKNRHKRGVGGHGKYSKGAAGKKPTQKQDLRMQCNTCKKMTTKAGFRAKKFELV